MGNQLTRVVHMMELLQPGGVSLNVDTLDFLIETFGCTFAQLLVLNRAVDGWLTISYKPGICSHTEGSNSPWLVVDLKGNYGISYVRIMNRADCCSK